MNQMRQAIIDGISALSLGTFAVSSELPWSASGQPLYEKNFKVFYVSEPDSTESNLFNTLDAGVFAKKDSTINVFVVVDAKQQPSNYDSLVQGVRDVKNTTDITGVTSRECNISTTFQNDSLLTQFIFRFTEVKIN
jgi:hypothetical protein